MQKDNLIPISERTTSEQREICSKGGKASGTARRKKRTMRAAAQMILSLPVCENDTVAVEALKNMGIENPTEYTNLEALMIVAYMRAKNGDHKALVFLRELIGEDPQINAYRERTELTNKAQETAAALVNDWINSIPE